MRRKPGEKRKRKWGIFLNASRAFPTHGKTASMRILYQLGRLAPVFCTDLFPTGESRIMGRLTGSITQRCRRFGRRPHPLGPIWIANIIQRPRFTISIGSARHLPDSDWRSIRTRSSAVQPGARMARTVIPRSVLRIEDPIQVRRD